MLPADVAMQYDIKFKLFAVNGTNKRELSTTTVKVTTSTEKTTLANLQEGKGLECIERPLPKTKPQGTSHRTPTRAVIEFLVKRKERRDLEGGVFLRCMIPLKYSTI